ncbi:hypothetical protein SAY86_017455 [Trapa natans]|uniref:R3H domain-containing protein n=1 Tax=Trapa natans TaxID=22666 RepID=A0AAN7LPB8_TRANT|nr:hypothetical protein SAY86_017455 [Trapa natans]
MGGGRRNSRHGSKNSSSGKSKSRSGGNRRSGGGGGGGRGGFSSSSSANVRSSLFVEGGFLSDWQLSTPPAPSQGTANPNPCGPIYRSSRRGQGSGSKGVLRYSSHTFGYRYPAPYVQKGGNSESSEKDNSGETAMDEPEPIILFNSKETQIMAYVDEKPSMAFHCANVNYDYHSDFVLGGLSHQGLGYDGESEALAIDVGVSSVQMEDQEEESACDMLSPENEIDEITEELVPDKSSIKKNAGFISIGNTRLYTEDLPDESDEGRVELSMESSELGESDDSSDCASSEGPLGSGSDIDDDVVEDYLEGIGGTGNLMDAEWLLDKGTDNETDSDDSSSSSLDGAMKKLGGIALQDASRDYGMMKSNRSKPQAYRLGSDSGSPAMEDLMLFKDMRSTYGMKNHTARFPQSWPPLVAQKSKRQRKFPGEKKKQRKESIAAKRRDRMLSRGVDLEQINLKLEQIVLDGVDMYSFQPMLSRDCSQVRRLAAIYQLQSGCQGSGKKRFVTVTRTQRTGLPSSSGKLRLEKV